MLDSNITIEDFTVEEKVKAMEILFEKKDTLNAIEFADILKKNENREEKQILGELIRCLRLGEKEKIKKWWEKYKNLKLG